MAGARDTSGDSEGTAGEEEAINKLRPLRTSLVVQ